MDTGEMIELQCALLVRSAMRDDDAAAGKILARLDEYERADVTRALATMAGWALALHADGEARMESLIDTLASRAVVAEAESELRGE